MKCEIETKLFKLSKLQKYNGLVKLGRSVDQYSRVLMSTSVTGKRIYRSTVCGEPVVLKVLYCL